MIILRNKYYSSKFGKFSAGVKGAIKPTAKGIKWGTIAASPFSLLALKRGKYKTAAGIAGAGMLIGGGIGAKLGYNKGVHDYKLKNDPEYAKKIKEEKIAEIKSRIKQDIKADKSLISNFDISSWKTLKNSIDVPDEFIKYAEFYKNHWSKKVDIWYSNMATDKISDVADIPDFADLFPIPWDSKMSKEWFERDERIGICLATCNNVADDGFIYYDPKQKLYGIDADYIDISLKNIIFDILKRTNDWYIFSQTQLNLIKEFKNKVNSL